MVFRVNINFGTLAVIVDVNLLVLLVSNEVTKRVNSFYASFLLIDNSIKMIMSKLVLLLLLLRTLIVCVPSLNESFDFDSSISDINDNSICEEAECDESSDLPKFPSHTFQKRVNIKKTGKKKGQKRVLVTLIQPPNSWRRKRDVPDGLVSFCCSGCEADGREYIPANPLTASGLNVSSPWFLYNSESMVKGDCQLSDGRRIILLSTNDHLKILARSRQILG